MILCRNPYSYVFDGKIREKNFLLIYSVRYMEYSISYFYLSGVLMISSYIDNLSKIHERPIIKWVYFVYKRTKNDFRLEIDEFDDV